MARLNQEAGGGVRRADARQASEQYFTASQFLAQALRQVMGLRHWQHNLLGRCCLLPLNALGMALSGDLPGDFPALVVDEPGAGFGRQLQQRLDHARHRHLGVQQV